MKAIEVKNLLFTGKRLGPHRNELGHRIRVVLDYAVVAPLLLAAFGLCYVLSPMVHGGPLFIIYVVASLGAAWYGGLGPGIVCLITGLLLGDYFFIEPAYQFGPNTTEAVTVIMLNAAAGCVGVAAIVNLQRARQRERQVRSLATQLGTEIEQHRKTLDELTVAKSRLDEHAQDLERCVAERTAKLRESVRSLEGVLYHVAHDLRSPLRALSGFSVLLMESLGPRLNAEEKVSMEKIVSSSARMDRLILDLLAYGRLAHLNPLFKTTDISAVVGRVLGGLQKEIATTHAVVETAPHMLKARTDATLLVRAVEELLRNSLEFTAPEVQPRIRIWTESCDSGVRLSVQDNGIGIDRSHQSRIFQVFERLHPSEDSGGTGIGLAMVAKTMQRLGGKAGVESEPGKGSRFWLELPQA